MIVYETKVVTEIAVNVVFAPVAHKLRRGEHIAPGADQSYELGEYKGGKVKYTYAVTALDRLHNESKPQKEKIKL